MKLLCGSCGAALGGLLQLKHATLRFCTACDNYELITIGDSVDHVTLRKEIGAARMRHKRGDKIHHWSYEHSCPARRALLTKDEAGVTCKKCLRRLEQSDAMLARLLKKETKGR